MRPTVRTEELLRILMDNREKHKAVYLASLAGFREQAAKKLRAAIRQLAEGNVFVSVSAPEDHSRDYDRAIRMVQLHTAETITLTEEDAAHFLLDDWDWKRHWLKMSSSYAPQSVTENYGEQGSEED